jgi:RNA 2',3'-cyclic 3'-phosphodiesterase
MGINKPEADNARLFFALWPSSELQRSLRNIALQRLGECGGRPMRSNTLHMTLLFLGAVKRLQIVELMHAAEKVVFSPFAFRLQQFACWPRNHIGYTAPMNEVEQLVWLVRILRQEVEEAGFGFDRKDFVPHVTLLRDIVHPVAPCLISPIEWQVSEFSLVESTLTEQGVHYQTLAIWQMRCLG